ncbi:MAG: LysR substrate-binding domain-containing protein [Comamonas sp.]
MDLPSLEIFLQVAQTGSITRAAEQLARAQSNVTTRIQQLEESLGVPLFVREARRMVLTPQGTLLQGYATRLLALAEEARQALQPGLPQGRLRLGSMESTAAARLPQPLARFHQAWPQVALELSTAPSRQLVERVLSFELDAALVAWPAPDIAADAPLVLTPMYEEPLCMILPQGVDPAARPLAVSTLAAFTEGCTYRRLGEAWMREVHGDGAGRWSVLELASYHAIVACVAAGGCVAVAPRIILELMRDAPPVQAVPLPSCTTMLLRRTGYQSPALDALLSCLQTTGENHAPPA